MRFIDWNISKKVLSQLLALGLVALLGLGFAMMRLSAIDTAYSKLIDGPASGTIDLARANRLAQAAISAIYENITATTDEANSLAIEKGNKARRDYDNEMAQARIALPDRASEIDALSRTFHDDFDRVCLPTIAAANSTDSDGNAKASVTMHRECEPDLVKLIASQTSLNDSALASMKKDSDDLTSTTNSTILWTSIALFSGLLIVLGGAVYLVKRFVTAPLKALARISQTRTSNFGVLADSNRQRS